MLCQTIWRQRPGSDLRDNPGGLLTNAIDISNMFLDSGNILSTVTAMVTKPLLSLMVILFVEASAL
jgi:hypothetical protein